ncbi:helix-turn-helix domain-containing protein [Curtobacterium flaccumfaciens]|nr:helix-turn-helix domain-containing protein [Curtobacterium flaccumfaciens]
MVQQGSSSFLADCPTRLTVEILSDKWSALVLFALRSGPMRHGALVDRIGGVSRKVLTQSLRRLQDYGLVDRVEGPARHIDYRLTELGRSLVGPIETLNAWAQEHAGAVQDHRDQVVRDRGR